MLINQIRRTACLLALLLPLTVGHAYGAPNSPMALSQSPQAPADPFNLTQGQKDKLKEINKSIQDQMNAVQASPGSRDVKTKQIVALLTDLEKQQRAVLDPTQLKLYDKQKSEQDAADTLHLTMQQKVEIHLIKQDTDKQVRAILSGSHTSVDARASAIERVIKAGKSQTKTYLTPAQAKAVEANDSRQMANDPLHRTFHQQIEMQLIQQDAMKQAAAVYDNKSLSPAQKKAKMAELGKSMKRTQDALLTPSQRAAESTLIAQQQQQQQKAAGH